MNMELLILKNLLKNDQYVKTILPFLKSEYFQQEDDRVIFDTVNSYVTQYSDPPSVDAIEVIINERRGLNENVVKGIKSKLATIKANTDTNTYDWLRTETEKFCRDKAIYNAIMKSIGIIQDEKSTLTKGAIPGLLSDALAISFDSYVGHDFFEQSDERFEYYHRIEEKIPLDLEFFNLITRNGIPKRSLTIVMAGPNVGKSLWMTHTTAHFLGLGKNVLYITLEMREEEIAKRIDCNMLNVTFDELEVLSKDMFDDKITKLKKKTSGKLIIKEYPTGGASVTHFRALLHELKLKKNFVPDAIFVDYMNICASSRMSLSRAEKHEYVISISEELRGLACEMNVPIVTATQINREGFKSSDISMGHIADAFGVNATADFLFCLQTNESLEELGQLAVIQLKNRLNTKAKNRKFVIGVDYTKMKLFDVEDSAQTLVDAHQSVPDTPIFDKGNNNTRFKGLKVT